MRRKRDTMLELDEIARLNQRLWDHEVVRGVRCTRPYLDLDVEEFRAVASGQ
jgi:hypothetical protein